MFVSEMIELLNRMPQHKLVHFADSADEWHAVSSVADAGDYVEIRVDFDFYFDDPTVLSADLQAALDNEVKK